MVTDKNCRVEAFIDSSHHSKWARTSGNQRRSTVEFLRLQVCLVPVRINYHNLTGTGLKGGSNRRVSFGDHLIPRSSIVASRRRRVARVHYSGKTFHINRNVDLETLLRARSGVVYNVPHLVSIGISNYSE